MLFTCRLQNTFVNSHTNPYSLRHCVTLIVTWQYKGQTKVIELVMYAVDIAHIQCHWDTRTCFCCWHSPKINTCPTANVNYRYKLSYHFVKRKHTGFEALIFHTSNYVKIWRAGWHCFSVACETRWPASGWLLFGRPLKKVRLAIWKSIPVNKLDLIHNIHFMWPTLCLTFALIWQACIF